MPRAPGQDHAGGAVSDRAADRTLVIERVFAAPPEKVFAAWTNPAVLVKWWGPEGFSTPEHSLDVRPGGRYRTTMRSAQGDSHTVSGVYHEVAPPRRLVFTWAWEENGVRGHETTVEITLEPVARGTRMRFVQALFDSVGERIGHSEGWESAFNELEKTFA